MEKEFIPYEQALELKELGFNEECFGCYELAEVRDYKNNGIEIRNEIVLNTLNGYRKYDDESQTSAPLYQQAFRWFREKHTYQCYIQFMNNSYAYWIGIKSIDFYYHSFNSTPRDMKIDSSWETYEEAELACLKKLIEICKKKQ